MEYELRPIRPEEWDAFVAADAIAFGWEPSASEFEDVQKIFEIDRSLATFDGTEVVSTTGIFSWELTVPGGSLPTAGVTWVSVKPTHRRQGILNSMMRRQLSDVHDRGEALAALWASESVIYGRFGYGLAAEALEVEIDRQRTTLGRAPEAPGRCRIVSRDEALSSWPAIYDRVRATQPGFYARNEAWWKHHSLRENERAQRGFHSRFFVQYEENGTPLGYVRYRTRGDQQNGAPNGTVAVNEMIAATKEASAALWSYIFGVDLMATITAFNRPVDEPLFWMLADPRRLVRKTYDSMWVRVVDVPPALEGRRYSAQGKLVLDVRDDFCPWVEGRYELEAGGEGARCRPTNADADIVMRAADLGAAYMGGTRFRSLARAGRVEGDADALARADAMFSWDPLPWCPEVF
jgi:predicted acetyltransferase